MSSNIESLQISDKEIKQITGCKFLLYETKKIVRKTKLNQEILKQEFKKPFWKRRNLDGNSPTIAISIFLFILGILGAYGGIFILAVIGSLLYDLLYYLLDYRIAYSIITLYGIFAVIGYILGIIWSAQLIQKQSIKRINNMPPTPLEILLDEVDKFNKAAKQMDVVNQLEAVGNKGVFKDKDKIINALTSVREDLIRALKTERILRENPEFNAAQLSVDLTALRALDIGEQTGEYRQIVSDVWEIALSVQDEMNKLQSLRA